MIGNFLHSLPVSLFTTFLASFILFRFVSSIVASVEFTKLPSSNIFFSQRTKKRAPLHGEPQLRSAVVPCAHELHRCRAGHYRPPGRAQLARVQLLPRLCHLLAHPLVLLPDGRAADGSTANGSKVVLHGHHGLHVLDHLVPRPRKRHREVVLPPPRVSLPHHVHNTDSLQRGHPQRDRVL